MRTGTAAPAKAEPKAKTKPGVARGACLCGAIVIEIDTPAFWAFHYHGKASRRAHGAAYATYLGVWKSKMRIAKGARAIARYADAATNTTRSFCAKCGSPVLYERARDTRMINVPRALFDGRTGREPRYHLAIQEMQDWAYAGQTLAPLKGYPGVVWDRGKGRKPPIPEDIL